MNGANMKCSISHFSNNGSKRKNWSCSICLIDSQWNMQDISNDSNLKKSASTKTSSLVSKK
ncbi:unnamed protein product [Caenorhabditis brenneri]